MSEEVYTVEQFAERLKLHPKTVLRFIKDGRLRAVKVGKSYRILRTEMEAMVTGYSPEEFPGAIDAYRGVFQGRTGPARVRADARVTSIVDLAGVAPDLAERMARMLPAARTGQAARADAMNIEVIYDLARQQLKVLIVGSPGDTAAILKMVEVLAES
jgi:excisionase family DNA binding protein